MMLARITRFPQKLVTDEDYMMWMVKHEANYLLRHYSNGSAVWRNWKVELFEQDADNIIHGLVTLRVSANKYKAPRIINRLK